MIFSVGYGRDERGTLTMHFGPLNRQGGERRLNVAITRAKEKIILVSSIRASDIDLTGNSPAGVLTLYHYLIMQKEVQLHYSWLLLTTVSLNLHLRKTSLKRYDKWDMTYYPKSVVVVIE